jgi:hypothetical protein
MAEAGKEDIEKPFIVIIPDKPRPVPHLQNDKNRKGRKQKPDKAGCDPWAP